MTGLSSQMSGHKSARYTKARLPVRARRQFGQVQISISSKRGRSQKGAKGDKNNSIASDYGRLEMCDPIGNTAADRTLVDVSTHL
jgi:hypothetical protein